MDDLDLPIPEGIETHAAQLRQTAYLCGTFWRALLDAGIPAHLADDLVRTWFDDADDLEVAALDIDDD